MALDFLKEGLMLGLDSVTGGGSRLLPEDTMAKIPIFGPLSGAQTDEEKRLIEKQKEMAEEAKKRQVEMQRIHRACERNLLPFQPRRPHVDGDPPAAGILGHDHAGRRIDGHPARPALAHQQLRHAARGVAAGLDLATVGIADPQGRVRRAVLRRLDDDELVAAHAGLAVGDRPCLGVAQGQGRGAGIDDDEIVAQAVHLDEGATAHGVGL